MFLVADKDRRRLDLLILIPVLPKGRLCLRRELERDLDVDRDLDDTERPRRRPRPRDLDLPLDLPRLLDLLRGPPGVALRFLRVPFREHSNVDSSCNIAVDDIN